MWTRKEPYTHSKEPKVMFFLSKGSACLVPRHTLPFDKKKYYFSPSTILVFLSKKSTGHTYNQTSDSILSDKTFVFPPDDFSTHNICVSTHTYFVWHKIFCLTIRQVIPFWQNICVSTERFFPPQSFFSPQQFWVLLFKKTYRHCRVQGMYFIMFSGDIWWDSWWDMGPLDERHGTIAF